MTQDTPFQPRQIQLEHPDKAPRWYFAQGIDLEHWLPAITNHPGDGQDNDGSLVAAFHAEFAPSLRHGKLMAASQEMYLLLKAGLPLLRKAAVENEDKELRQMCDDMTERLAEVDATPTDENVRGAW